jgi:hypothetical protein
MHPTRPWKIAGAATAALGALTGYALSSDGIDLRDRADAVELTATPIEDVASIHDIGGSPRPADGPAQSPFDAPPSASDIPSIHDVDASPESADSPAESPFDSPESASDSPDDPGFVDASPESADSPAESPADSPPPAPAPSGDDSPDSADSPESADSPD